MFVSICPYLYDPAGGLLLEALPDSRIDHVSRRVTRTATLDGNAALVDGGYTAADAEFEIRARVTRATETRLQQIVRTHPLVTVATRYGVFLGVIDRLTYDAGAGSVQARFLVSRQLTE